MEKKKRNNDWLSTVKPLKDLYETTYFAEKSTFEFEFEEDVFIKEARKMYMRKRKNMKYSDEKILEASLKYDSWYMKYFQAGWVGGARAYSKEVRIRLENIVKGFYFGKEKEEIIIGEEKERKFLIEKQELKNSIIENIGVKEGKVKIVKYWLGKVKGILEERLGRKKVERRLERMMWRYIGREKLTEKELALCDDYYWRILIYHPESLTKKVTLSGLKIIADTHREWYEKELIRLFDIVKKKKRVEKREIKDVTELVEIVEDRKIFLELMKRKDEEQQKVIKKGNRLGGIHNEKSWNETYWVDRLGALGIYVKEIDYRIEYKLWELAYGKSAVFVSSPEVAKGFYSGYLGFLYWLRMPKKFLRKSDPMNLVQLLMGNSSEHGGIKIKKISKILLGLSILYGSCTKYFFFDFWYNILGDRDFPVGVWLNTNFWLLSYMFFFIIVSIYFVDVFILLLSLYIRIYKRGASLRALKPADDAAELEREEMKTELYEVASFAFPYFIEYPFHVHFKFTPYIRADYLYRYYVWVSGQNVIYYEWEMYNYLREKKEWLVDERKHRLEEKEMGELKEIQTINEVNRLVRRDYSMELEKARLWSRKKIIIKWVGLLMEVVGDKVIVNRFLQKRFKDILRMEYILYKRGWIRIEEEEKEETGDYVDSDKKEKKKLEKSFKINKIK